METPFITVTGITRILDLLGMEIEAKHSENQHVHTIIYEVENFMDGSPLERSRILYAEIQHTESSKCKRPENVDNDTLWEWRRCRAIRMSYLDLQRLGIITQEALQNIPQDLIHKNDYKFGYVEGRLQTMKSYCDQNALDLFLKRYSS